MMGKCDKTMLLKFPFQRPIVGSDINSDDDVVELIQTRRSQHPKPGNFTLPPVRQAEPDQASKRQRVVEKPGSGKIDLCE